MTAVLLRRMSYHNAYGATIAHVPVGERSTKDISINSLFSYSISVVQIHKNNMNDVLILECISRFRLSCLCES